MHTLVQGLEDASMDKYIIEEYKTINNLQNRLTLDKIKERHETMNMLSNYNRGKNLELERSWDNLRSNKGTPKRRGTQPNSRPTCTFCNYHGSSCEERNKKARPTTRPATSAGSRPLYDFMTL